MGFWGLKGFSYTQVSGSSTSPLMMIVTFFPVLTDHDETFDRPQLAGGKPSQANLYPSALASAAWAEFDYFGAYSNEG